jgi:hypothetical protein
MKTEDYYREACRKQHRLLGHYLAIQSWLGQVDCLVLERKNLDSFLGLKRFKAVRVEWLMEDLKPWFPYQVPFYRANSMSSISTLYLSRVSISEHLPSGTFSTRVRVSLMATGSPKTAILYELIGKGTKLDTGNITAYLGMLSSGLMDPSTDVDLRISKKPKSDAERLHASSLIKQDFEEEVTEALSNILLGEKIPLEVINRKTDTVLIPANVKITRTMIKRVANSPQYIEMEPSPIQIKIEGLIHDLMKKHRV